MFVRTVVAVEVYEQPVVGQHGLVAGFKSVDFFRNDGVQVSHFQHAGIFCGSGIFGDMFPIDGFIDCYAKCIY